MSKRTLIWTWYCLRYIATTQIGHLEDYSITTLFEIKSFCKWTHKIQGSTIYATEKNFTALQTYLISQETALKFMNVISLFV